MNIDMICEDCDEFICTRCAKTDHKDHDWNTILTAGRLRRKELQKNLSNIKEEGVKEIDEKIKNSAKRMEDNLKCCDDEVCKLQKHYDAIVTKLDKIKKNYEIAFRKNLERKNAEVSEKSLDLENKKKQLMDFVKFLEVKHSTMSDYCLIDNLRDLTIILSTSNSEIDQGNLSMR